MSDARCRAERITSHDASPRVAQHAAYGNVRESGEGRGAGRLDSERFCRMSRWASVIEVVGAVIVRDGLVYCVQRGPDANLPGMWEFPGGKLEDGEDAATALTREVREELLCEVQVNQEVTTTSHEYDFGTVCLTTFYCTIVDGAPSLTEHAAELWLDPAELSELEWAPADIPAVRIIQSQLTQSYPDG